MPYKSTNMKVAQGKKTFAELLEIARSLFASQGYAATTTAQIIATAGVTKGALYHHFASKRALFEAVYIAAEQEVAARIDAVSGTTDGPFEQLINGCNAYLEACSDPGLQQILRIDGPSALGLDTWRQIDQQFGLDRLTPFLEHLAQANIIKVPSVPAFAHQLTGAMNEATFWIAKHRNSHAALQQSKAMLAVLLQGVRSPTTPRKNSAQPK